MDHQDFARARRFKQIPGAIAGILQSIPRFFWCYIQWIWVHCKLCLILLGSLVLQLIFVPAPGFKSDIALYAKWMDAAVTHGLIGMFEKVWCDYPPGYLYMLQSVGLFWKHITGENAPVDSVRMRFLVKILPIAAVVLGALFVYYLAKKRFSSNHALLICAGYAFNPALLFNSAVWGQSDSILNLMLICSFWLIFTRNAFWGFSLFAFTILTKFQAAVLFPLLLITTYLLERSAGLKKAFWGITGTSLLTLFIFYWNNGITWVMSVASSASGRYPYLSMNACNIWYLVGGAHANQTSDALRLANARFDCYALGMIIFFVFSALIWWRFLSSYLRFREVALESLCLSSALQMLAFYLFPTEMHERYVIPTVIFLAVASVVRPIFWWFYAIVSLLISWSLASTLHDYYPDGSWLIGDVLRKLGILELLFPDSRHDMKILSYLFLLLFTVLFFFSRDKRFLSVAAGIIILVAGTLSAALFIPYTGVIHLETWRPVEVYQQWGSMTKNLSVEKQRLSIHGHVFRRGLGLNTYSWIKYHLNEQYSAFDVIHGMNQEQYANKVQFRIHADFKEGSELKRRTLYDSGIVSNGLPPRHVTISVKQAEYLILEVLDGGDTINYDNVSWVEPLLIR